MNTLATRNSPEHQDPAPFRSKRPRLEHTYNNHVPNFTQPNPLGLDENDIRRLFPADIANVSTRAPNSQVNAVLAESDGDIKAAIHKLS